MLRKIIVPCLLLFPLTAPAAAPIEVNAKAALARAEAFLSSTSPEEQKRGFRTLKEKAEGGSEPAQLRLAELYHRGIGVKKDPGAAWSWYEKAGAQGSAEALRRLSIRYRLGCDGAAKDLEKSENYLKSARAYASKEEVAVIEEAGKAPCPN